MSDHKHIIPFIKGHEGGWVNNPADPGGETNKGITYVVWCSVFGTQAHSRFMAMSDDDWATIFKKLYWDSVQGDDIKSQRIADELAEWAWGSGRYYPAQTLQTILINLGFALKADGVIGAGTIAAINAADEKQLYKALVTARVKFLAHIPINNPSQKIFIDGWLNRMMDLIFTQVTI